MASGIVVPEFTGLVVQVETPEATQIPTVNLSRNPARRAYQSQVSFGGEGKCVNSYVDGEDLTLVDSSGVGLG